MSSPKKIIVGGAASIFGLSSIKQAFASLGIEASFVEAPFMRDYVTIHEDESVTFTAKGSDADVVVPLTEFWISYCKRTKRCRISDKALLASRSKKYFYDVLASCGVDTVHSYANKEEARAVLDNGTAIVIKPQGLCSGLGVEVLDPSRKEMFDAYVEKTLSIHTKNMKLMELTNEGCLFTEYIPGTEYSADCFYYNGRISIVRVCKKRIVVLRDKPCTAIYQLVKPSEAIEQKLTSWMNALFENDNISFAQFDFIITPDEKRIVPIDFASRIGGGLTEMMMQSGTNPYADAVRGECHLFDKRQLGVSSAECSANKTSITDDRNYSVLTQLNYLPTVNGYLQSDDFPLAEGYRVVFKHKGDYVISNPSSIGSRVALVIQERESEMLPVDFEKTLFIDERWIAKDTHCKQTE